MTSSTDRRIARNSAFLYGRMILTIGISLYTSRVVLDTLGVDDFGIYNVVAAIVTIFAFLNGSMAGATQRFLNFEMGRRHSERLRQTFRSSVLIHAAIALAVLILGETAGVWYVNNHLVVEPARLYAANWTFQLSLAACVCTIIQVPFTAAVIAHERMDALAVITLLNAFLKFGGALSLALFATLDTLIIYAALMLAVTVLTLGCFIAYARRNFEECRRRASTPREVIRSLLGFSLADIFGNMCYSLRLQSVAVILNRFGGEALNAAVGLNLQVSGAITQFGTTIISAFRPQIIQQYAAENFPYMQRLMVNCAKYSLLMISLIAIPAIVGMDFLLDLWLKEVPEYTAAFCRLTLVAGAAELVVFTLNCGVHATGHIKTMSITTGVIYLVEIPTMWLLLRLTQIPWIVYALHIAVMFTVITAVGLILRRLMPQFAFGQFLGRAVVRPLLFIVPAFAAALAVWQIFSAPWLAFLTAGAASTAVLGILSWNFAIDSETRSEILVKFHLKKKTQARL